MNEQAIIAHMLMLLKQLELREEYLEFRALGHDEEETIGYLSYIISKYYTEIVWE